MTTHNTGTGKQFPEPFRMVAETYLDMGLSVLPCGGTDGKKPLVKWAGLQKRRIGSKVLDKWLVSFANANIGFVTGELSGITIIDSDNPNVTLRELFHVYGETPLVARTPRGGHHLYYQHNGEGCLQDAALKIDIRGEGGFVLAPPSYSRTTGEVYYFIEGGIWEIPNLPAIKKTVNLQREYNEGERNRGLFYYLLGEAKLCPTIAALYHIAEAFNHDYLIPPLEISEVHRTVDSIWKYKVNGTLTNTGEQFIMLPVQKLEPIRFKHTRAYALYADLIACHRGVNTTFAISPKAYAKRCQWSAKTVRQEIHTLLLYGLIRRVYEGGNKPHDPSLYSFT